MAQEEKKSKASNLRKVDNRIRLLVENGVAKHQRSMFVVVGDHGKDQVVFLHHILNKSLTEARDEKRILWLYKEKLGFTSHRNKKMKKLSKKVRSGIVDDNDPFQLFITSNKIDYYKYDKETQKVLGKTYSMAILQDFEAMTPNVLARAVETVRGGGVVIVLLPTKQLASLDMEVHKHYRTEAHQDVIARFNTRFMKSLSSCPACMFLDDRLNVLSYSFTLEQVPPRSIQDKPSILEGVEEDINELTKPLVMKCATVDQRNAVMKLTDIIAEKSLRTTVALTAGRGRGKSAALGLAIASAVAHQYSNIFVTAPTPENLKTLFDFVLVGFDVLGYKDNKDYTIIRSTNEEFKNAIVRINVTMSHRQTIQYIHPTDSGKLGQAELVCVDEAAAIPLPLVKDMLGPYLVFLSSTISGYEGTGRSLSLKLISQLRTQAGQSATAAGEGVALSGRKLEEMTLNESIRYANRDPIERWLNGFLCLDASLSRTPECCNPDACQLFYVNRDQLFNYGKVSEAFLQRLMALFVSSHYKNSPNDLQMLADAPAHHIFVLLGPVSAKTTGLPDILCAVQVCLEGELSKTTIMNQIARGKRASGDMIPWQISRQYDNSDFGTLSGARIVRIATHPDCIRMKYGSKTLELLQQYYEGKMASLDEADDTDEMGGEGEKPLLLQLSKRRAEHLNYLGVAYGLTQELLKFWLKGGFTPVHLRQATSDLTGEHSCTMLKRINVEDVEISSDWLNAFWTDFRGRFIELLASCFRSFKPTMALYILDQNRFLASCGNSSTDTLLSAYEIARLDRYKRNQVEYLHILDLVPSLAQFYFKGKIKVKLPQLQQLVLLTMGLQHKSAEDVVKENENLNHPAVMGVFHRIIGILTEELQKRLHREVGATLPEQNEAELSQLKPMKQSLEDDLKEAAAAVNLSQYAIKGSDSDWAQALPENTAITNIVSIKGLSKAKRKLENGAEAADTDSFKRKDKKMRTDKKTKKKGGR